jgi:hypothetical protein
VPNADGLTRSEVTIEMVFDPPGHTRLSITDDEIIDRALAVESLAGRKVTLLTYDTGQSTRARNAGLQVLKLRQEIGDEPTPVPRPRRASATQPEPDGQPGNWPGTWARRLLSEIRLGRTHQ